jgi:hypothetical protein
VTYPDGATGSADVVLVLTIGTDGSVRSATAAEGNAPFALQAEQAALTWRFQPAQRDGRPVAATIRFRVSFSEPAAPAEAPASAGRARELSSDRSAREQPIVIDVQGEVIEPARRASLSRAEVREIPGAFGDPFRAIETLPGVTPIYSGLPFFFMRGAPPGNAGYFLDGVRVPLLFHVAVGPSVVHPGLIRAVDLYPGGYPARFGRFSGGIVSGETTPPSHELRGEYNVRTVDAGALVEAPYANGRGSLLLGGRYSYTAALFSLLSADVVVDYWDYQARGTYALNTHDMIGVFAFGSYDYLGQRTPRSTETLFGAEFHRVDTRFDRRWGSRGRLRLAATFGLDRSRLPDNRVLRDRVVGARSELEVELSRSVLLRAGTDVQLDAYDMDLNTALLGPASRRAAESFPSRTDVVVGARADVVVRVDPRLEVIPGARLDYFVSAGRTAVALDPRIASRLALAKGFSFLSAFGMAHQTPSFVVPVPGFQPGSLRGGLQRSVQQSAGVEVGLPGATVASATVFHNAYFALSDAMGATRRTANGCAPGQLPTDSLAGDGGGDALQSQDCGAARFPPNTVGPDASGGAGDGADPSGAERAVDRFETRTDGRAYGLELFVKNKLTSRLGAFASYTLSRSTRTLAREQFVAGFDRTHVVNGGLAYDLGRRWRAGTRILFYTGLPKEADPTNRGSARLPPFFRLDLRLEKRWQLSARSWIAAVAEWSNATLTREAVATDCTANGCTTRTIGPVTIPSLGVEGGF